MAGTADNFDVTTIRAGSIGKLYYNVAVPGAGARLTLDTDGSPDSVANPNAKHLGMTRAGAKITIGVSTTQHFADEFQEPIKETIDKLDGMIECELLQVEDWDALAAMTAMTGTIATASGYEQIRFGRRTITPVPIALIFPTEADVAKFAVFQLYKAINVAPFSFDLARAAMSGIQCQFKGYAIPTRAVTDSLGSYWHQIT